MVAPAFLSNLPRVMNDCLVPAVYTMVRIAKPVNKNVIAACHDT